MTTTMAKTVSSHSTSYSSTTKHLINKIPAKENNRISSFSLTVRNSKSSIPVSTTVDSSLFNYFPLISSSPTTITTTTTTTTTATASTSMVLTTLRKSILPLNSPLLSLILQSSNSSLPPSTVTPPPIISSSFAFSSSPPSTSFSLPSTADNVAELLPIIALSFNSSKFQQKHQKLISLSTTTPLTATATAATTTTKISPVSSMQSLSSPKQIITTTPSSLHQIISTRSTSPTIISHSNKRPTIIIYPTVSPESVVIPIVSCILGFPVLALMVICCLRRRAKLARERDRRRNYDMQDHAVSLVRFSPIHRLNNRSSRAISLRPERSLSHGFPSLELDTVIEERSDQEQTQTDILSPESPSEPHKLRDFNSS